MADPPHNSSLVVIQRGTVGPPVYCFHAFSGSIVPYWEVARGLGRDRVVYGLQGISTPSGATPRHGVLGLGRRYAAQIAAHPPAGTSVLLGYSLGGVLAVETARLLADVLAVPPAVVAVDADPEYTPVGPADGWRILTRQVLDLDLPVDDLSALPRERALAAVRQAAAAERRLPARFSLDRLGAMLDVAHANEQAAARYRPQPFPGTVHSIRSGDSYAGRADPWQRYADRVRRHRIPGDHHSIMSAGGAAQLAAYVRGLFAEPTGSEETP